MFYLIRWVYLQITCLLVNPRKHPPYPYWYSRHNKFSGGLVEGIARTIEGINIGGGNLATVITSFEIVLLIQHIALH